MTQKFRDRIEHRKLKRSLHADLFGKQNKKIGNYLSLDSRWIRQSRLNFNYIYKCPSSYWPDWAINQFNVNSNKGVIHELSCLNFSQREVFSFNVNQLMNRVDITKQGYISFPYLGWGMDFKEWHNDEWVSYFKRPVFLSSDKAMLCYTHKGDNNIKAMISICFDSESNQLLVELSIENCSDIDVEKRISVGLIPYTNEGIGGLKYIQYLSNHSFLVDDQAIVYCSQQPHNVVCTTFEQGNVFKSNWDMIFHAKCDDCLASGIMTHKIHLTKGEKKNITFKVKQLNKFITPLLFPFKKTIKQRLSVHLNASDDNCAIQQHQSTNGCRVTNVDDHLNKTELLTQNHTLTVSDSYKTSIFEDFYFKVLASCKLNLLDSVNEMIMYFLSSESSFDQFHYLTNKQSYLFYDAMVFNVIDRYGLSDKHNQLVQKLIKKLKSDYFYKYIKALSLTKFKIVMDSPRQGAFVLKLCVMFCVVNILKQAKVSYKHSHEIYHIYARFFKLVFDENSTKMHIFNQWMRNNELTLAQKIFLCQNVFPVIFSGDDVQTIIDALKTVYVKDGQLVDLDHHHGPSEKERLLFSYLLDSKTAANVMNNYVSNINSFGQFYDPSSMSFKEFPQNHKSHHAVFISRWMDTICNTSDQSLCIVAPRNFKELTIENCRTQFGCLSIDMTNNGMLKKLELSYEFKVLPESIEVHLPESATTYGFSNNQNEFKPVPESGVVVLLEQNILYWTVEK